MAGQRQAASRRTPGRAGSAGSRGAGPAGAGPAGAKAAAGPPADAKAAAVPPAATLPPAPPWLRWSTLILSLGGLGVSTYLTIEHYTTNAFVGCPENSTINCVKVTTSSQSVVFGIFPVAVLGLAFFVFMVAASSPWAWRSPLPALRWARLGSVVVGIGFVLYLVYAELFQIKAICLYCTSVHVITFVLFVLIVFDATFRQPVVAAKSR